MNIAKLTALVKLKLLMPRNVLNGIMTMCEDTSEISTGYFLVKHHGELSSIFVEEMG